jgi:hypothetical protein
LTWCHPPRPRALSAPSAAPVAVPASFASRLTRCSMSDTSCVRTHRARTLATPRLHDDRQGSCPRDRIMASSRPRCSQAAQGCPEQLAPIAEAHTQILEILSDQLRQDTCSYAAARDREAMPRCPRLPSRLGHCSPLPYLKFWFACTPIAPCPRPNSLDNRLSVHGY